MAFAAVFGDVLLTKAGLKPTEEVLAGKAGVLVYFSAHWCPPCKGFTPKLAEFHTKHADVKNFQTIFVSSDRDEAAFAEYYGEMPWAALPFDKRELKEKLSKKYKVEGIPCLVVLDHNGALVTKDGRSAVMENFDTAEGFPWIPPTFAEAIGNAFVAKDGSVVNLDALRGKTLGLYFSAHWCPPCRTFTPLLKQFYADMKAKDPNFEIIFVSSDKTEAEMQSYFQNDHGDYLALPFENRKGKEALSKLCGVDGIPSFAVVDSNSGKIVNANARSKVSEGVDAILADGWGPAVVGDMAKVSEGVDAINECPSIVVICDQAPPAVQASIADAMKPLGARYYAASQAKDEDPEYIFLYAKGGGFLEQLKALTQKDASAEFTEAGDKPLMLLFDIPDNGGFYVSSEHDITTANIEKFIAEKQAGSLTRKQLGK